MNEPRILATITVAVCLATISPRVACGQNSSAKVVRVGIFPMLDATGSNSRTAGVAATQRMVDELSTGRQLVATASRAASTQ